MSHGFAVVPYKRVPLFFCIFLFFLFQFSFCVLLFFLFSLFLDTVVGRWLSSLLACFLDCVLSFLAWFLALFAFFSGLVGQEVVAGASASLGTKGASPFCNPLSKHFQARFRAWWIRGWLRVLEHLQKQGCLGHCLLACLLPATGTETRGTQTGTTPK